MLKEQKRESEEMPSEDVLSVENVAATLEKIAADHGKAIMHDKKNHLKFTLTVEED